MSKRFCWFCILVLGAQAAFADESVRQVQEELRKRNLYFGDIDGQATADLANSLKRYQARKGFPPTGALDATTAASLSVELTETVANKADPPPEGPILKSDRARQLPDEQRLALEQAADENPDAVPGPPPPAESPAPDQDLKPERINSLVADYLRDGETTDIAAQTRYFSYPVDYFGHGSQGSTFVEKDVSDYVKRWPDRSYTLLRPPGFIASAREGETIIEFPISYTVRRGKTLARGKTMNTWIVRLEGNELKIISIQERRLRE